MQVATQTLAEFLLARIAEDEEAARAAADTWDHYVNYEYGVDREHGDRWSPSVVLTECEVKRRIVELYQHAEDANESDRRRVMAGGHPHPEVVPLLRARISALRPVSQLLALPYADHPDYDETWGP